MYFLWTTTHVAISRWVWNSHADNLSVPSAYVLWQWTFNELPARGKKKKKKRKIPPFTFSFSLSLLSFFWWSIVCNNTRRSRPSFAHNVSPGVCSALWPQLVFILLQRVWLIWVWFISNFYVIMSKTSNLLRTTNNSSRLRNVSIMSRGQCHYTVFSQDGNEMEM